jgi:hypothetical protein
MPEPSDMACCSTGADQLAINGVSCTSPTSCIAVGEYESARFYHASFTPLSERWNGRSWRLLPRIPLNVCEVGCRYRSPANGVTNMNSVFLFVGEVLPRCRRRMAWARAWLAPGGRLEREALDRSVRSDAPPRRCRSFWRFLCDHHDVRCGGRHRLLGSGRPSWSAGGGRAVERDDVEAGHAPKARGVPASGCLSDDQSLRGGWPDHEWFRFGAGVEWTPVAGGADSTTVADARRNCRAPLRHAQLGVV